MLSAAARSAAEMMRCARSRARTSIANIPSVPLSRLSPSLGCNTNGSSPAARSAAAAGSTAPPMRTSPSPITGRARWAKGARSPDAPTDPCPGTTGSMSSRNMSRRRWTTSTRTPEWP